MLIIVCPKCNDPIIIEQLNCSVFRHATYKHNYEQIPPHSSKSLIDDLLKNNSIFGCGTPFKIIDNKPFICDYI